jgi:hypothetical protein
MSVMYDVRSMGIRPIEHYSNVMEIIKSQLKTDVSKNIILPDRNHTNDITPFSYVSIYKIHSV